jgi:hypothetical protein
VKLYHSITLIVTANDSDTREQMTTEFVALFSDLFGGATVVNGSGGWINGEDMLVVEPNTQVTAFSDRLANSMYRDIKDDIRIEFSAADQEAVAFIVDGTVMHIYDVDDLPEDLD